MADHTPEARGPEPGCQAVSIEGFVCSEPPNHTGDHIARVPNGLLVKQWAGDKHANHGRGSATDGPNEPDCPCRGTGEEAECANAGCGFCRRSTVPTGYAPSTPPEERRAFLKSLASTPGARSSESERVEEIRENLRRHLSGEAEDSTDFASCIASYDVPWLLSQLDAKAARVRELEQDAERLDKLEEMIEDSRGRRFMLGPTKSDGLAYIETWGHSDIRTLIDETELTDRGAARPQEKSR